MCDLIDRQAGYLTYSREIEVYNLRSKIEALRNELNETRTELDEAKAKLVEYADKFAKYMFASLDSGGSGRRLAKDPEPFDANEKNIAKRQEIYIDWCNAINRVFQ